MAKAEFTRLFKAAQTNPDLREQLNTASNADQFVDRAQALGFNFTVKEWQEMTGFAVEEFECALSEIPGI